MSKGRTGERQQQKRNRPGLKNRERNERAQDREKRGDTRIDTLLRTFGDGFARGIRGDAHLKTLLERTGCNSLSDYLKTSEHLPASGKCEEDRAKKKDPEIRYASDEQFEAARKKTSALHGGLFRRLAERRTRGDILGPAALLSDAGPNRLDSPEPD